MTRFNRVSFGLLPNDVVALTDPQRLAIELFIGFSVVAEGPAEYKNFEYPRYKNFYGYCQLMCGTYVAESIPLHFLNQRLHYFQQHTIEGFQNVTCAIADVADHLPTPFEPTIVTVPSRNIIDSLRFHLRAGINANLTIAWEELQPECGDTVAPPDSRAGNAPPPQNSGYDPGSRPSGQGFPPSDNSPNDGQSGGPPLSPPPSPGGPGSGATWKVALSITDNDCNRPSFVHDTGVTDPTADISVTLTPTGLAPLCGATDKRIHIYSNGVDTGYGGSGGDPAVLGVYYS